MSPVAKNRFHRGQTAELRVRLRGAGVSLDEEMAQFVLGGVQPFAGQPGEFVTEIVNDVLAQRRVLMSAWEQTHPDKNPYPPSFPDRVRKLVVEALAACYSDDGSPVDILTRIKGMCEKELEIDPFTEPDTTPPEE